MKTKYLQAYEGLEQKGQLHGDRLLLEIMDINTEQKTTGGIIIATPEDYRTDFMMLTSTVGIVLEVGKGYYDPDTGEDIPLKTAVGNVVWIPDGSMRRLTTIPGFPSALPEKTLALGSDGEVIKKWNSIEEYEADKLALTKRLDNNG